MPLWRIKPATNVEIRDLIRRTRALPTLVWGAPRVHGELLKLGVDISQAMVGEVPAAAPKPPCPTWRSFLYNHLTAPVAIDTFKRWSRPRLIGSIRGDCLDHVVVFGEQPLHHLLSC
jgi:hypothetical protein